MHVSMICISEAILKLSKDRTVCKRACFVCLHTNALSFCVCDLHLVVMSPHYSRCQGAYETRSEYIKILEFETLVLDGFWWQKL